MSNKKLKAIICDFKFTSIWKQNVQINQSYANVEQMANIGFLYIRQWKKSSLWKGEEQRTTFRYLKLWLMQLQSKICMKIEFTNSEIYCKKLSFFFFSEIKNFPYTPSTNIRSEQLVVPIKTFHFIKFIKQIMMSPNKR